MISNNIIYRIKIYLFNEFKERVGISVSFLINLQKQCLNYVFDGEHRFSTMKNIYNNKNLNLLISLPNFIKILKKTFMTTKT